MLEPVLLQFVESIIQDYHVGHVLVLLFVLSVLAMIPLGSGKVMSLAVLSFGLLFLLTPGSTMGGDPLYKFLGLGLLVVAPVVYAFSRS
jgi:hypothetical protein